MINRAQKAFLVLMVLPTLLGLLIYNLQFTVDHRENPMPGITASWNTWHAYEHQWCYVLAGAVWFVAIWYLLQTPQSTE